MIDANAFLREAYLAHLQSDAGGVKPAVTQVARHQSPEPGGISRQPAQAVEGILVLCVPPLDLISGGGVCGRPRHARTSITDLHAYASFDDPWSGG